MLENFSGEHAPGPLEENRAFGNHKQKMFQQDTFAPLSKNFYSHPCWQLRYCVKTLQVIFIFLYCNPVRSLLYEPLHRAHGLCQLMKAFLTFYEIYF